MFECCDFFILMSTIGIIFRIDWRYLSKRSVLRFGAIYHLWILGKYLNVETRMGPKGISAHSCFVWVLITRTFRRAKGK